MADGDRIHHVRPQGFGSKRKCRKDRLFSQPGMSGQELLVRLAGAKRFQDVFDRYAGTCDHGLAHENTRVACDQLTAQVSIPARWP